MNNVLREGNERCERAREEEEEGEGRGMEEGGKRRVERLKNLRKKMKIYESLAVIRRDIKNGKATRENGKQLLRTPFGTVRK